MIGRVYRAVLHLYPRAFRREYGDDMAALLRDQLRDEGAARVVGRTALDLLVTVPMCHLEAHMSHSSTIAVVVVLASLGALLAIVGGPVGVGAGVAAIAVAALIWSRNRPVTATRRGGRLLLAGTGLLAAFVVVTTAIGELPDGGWYVAMFALMTSLVLIATGIVLRISSIGS